MSKTITRNATEQEAIHMLNLIALASVMDHLLTQLSAFPKFYRHKVKYHANSLAEQLKPYIEEDLADLFTVDDHNTECMYDRATALIKELTNLRPEQWQLVAYAAEIVKQPGTMPFFQLQAICNGFESNKKTVTV